MAASQNPGNSSIESPGRSAYPPRLAGRAGGYAFPAEFLHRFVEALTHDCGQGPALTRESRRAFGLAPHCVLQFSVFQRSRFVLVGFERDEITDRRNTW